VMPFLMRSVDHYSEKTLQGARLCPGLGGIAQKPLQLCNQCKRA
jgi:hypothetical protein